jgi:two-component system sensor histidine kinase TctE
MTVLFLLGGIALYIGANVYGRASADRSFDRLLSGSALSILEATSVVNDQVQVDLPYAALDMLAAARDDRVFYRVVAPSGVTVTGYPDLPIPSGLLMKAQQQFSGEPYFFDMSYQGETVRFVVFGRQVATPKGTRWLWVQVGQTRQARDRVARETIISSLLPIAVMTLLALIGVWFGIRSAFRPLGVVARDLTTRQPSDLQPLTTRVPSDLLPFVDATNDFMSRLDESMRTLRTFIADASHQMRTPLAAMLAYAYVKDDNPTEMRSSLVAIERNGKRLSNLFNQLLSDATVSHRANLKAFGTIDLVAVIGTSIRDIVETCPDSDIRFQTSLQEARFHGDFVLLKEAIKNLIHNAVKYGSAGDTPVIVSLNLQPQAYIITVLDEGPGLGDIDAETLFARFNKSSSSNGGAGIGLAIVRQAVRSHDGEVRLSNRHSGGAQAEICLPVTAI